MEGLNLVSNVAEDTDRDFNSLVRANVLAKDCFLIKRGMCLEFSFGNNSNFPIVVLIDCCERKFLEQIACFKYKPHETIEIFQL